jgi:hemolysin activation/secretion protein
MNISPNAGCYKIFAVLVLVLPLAYPVFAQSGRAVVLPQPESVLQDLRQQERERAVRQRNERTASQLEPVQAVSTTRLPAAEAPCFRIERITLEGRDSGAFQWVLGHLDEPGAGGDQSAGGGKDAPLGRCLGTRGIDIILRRAQNVLIARGWVTTRVLVGAQDLSSGHLKLTLIPGRIAAIRPIDANKQERPVSLGLLAALPMKEGDILNLRDLEQGLENLKRLPTADADIQIAPARGDAHQSAQPGQSDLLIQYQRAFPLRLSLGLDNSGTRATGKIQSSATVAWDGPLGLNDLFYINIGHDALNYGERGTRGLSVHYDIPWGPWLLGATYSQSQYHQSVAGYSQNYVYAGQQRNGELRLTRLLYRDSGRRISASVRAWGRSVNNWIDDTAVAVQHRITGGWELGLNDHELLSVGASRASLDANLAWRQGTGAFGSIPAPEQKYGEGTARMQMVLADMSFDLPFKLGAQQWRYTGQWRGQLEATALTPQDLFSLGGFYSVRGFDGESLLMGERGWLLRNDLGWAVPGTPGAQLYLGLDYGQIGGPTARQMAGNHLAGAALGVRGALYKKFNYDIYIGAPLVKPPGFVTARYVTGFNLILNL